MRDPGTALWREEFDGSAGAGVDRKTWKVESGAGGWGNGELQAYTRSPDNLSLDGASSLRITARPQAVVDAQGRRAAYTSARIMTRRALEVGRLEARLLLPSGTGTWPAFWTLGADWYDAGWPASGEIDVAEVWDGADRLANVAHAALLDADGRRTTRPWDVDVRLAPFEGPSWAGDWHVYAVDVLPDRLVFSVDHRVTTEVLRSERSAEQDWPFDQPQFCVLNVAVHAGAPEQALFQQPVTMLVDYVRAYPREP